MANGILQAFESGIGDCIFLTLDDNGNTFSIMVDCGKLTSQIKDYIVNTLHSHIDILIVTHIDNDHIIGLESIIKEIEELEIETILYNCSQKCGFEHGKELPQGIEDNLKLKNNLQGNIQPIKKDISAERALSLAQLIHNSKELRESWNKQMDYVTDEYPDITLPNGFGTIIFLSPQRQSLENLNNEFRKAFIAKSYSIYEGPYNIEPTLYEMLLLSIDSRVCEKREIGSTKATVKSVSDLSSAIYTTTISDSNESSIAFVWECNGKKILFCGDASPEVITCNLLKRYHTKEGKLNFEAIKIPHHGSRHSIGRMFWDSFDSKHVFVCGASERYGTPSKECLSKIIGRETEKTRHIHCTNRSKAMDWINADELKYYFKFEIGNNCRYEFEY